jgi:hypothetical protein
MCAVCADHLLITYCGVCLNKKDNKKQQSNEHNNSNNRHNNSNQYVCNLNASVGSFQIKRICIALILHCSQSCFLAAFLGKMPATHGKAALPTEIEQTLQAMAPGMASKLRGVYWPLRTSLDRLYLPNSQVIAIRDEVLALLKEHGLLQKKQRVHCRYAGVHPSNRYGDGIVPADVMTLISGIYKMAFSFKELDKPTAIELAPPSHPRRAQHLHFNIAQMRGSNGRLPEYEDQGEQIKILTATCGHTTQGLRCIWHGSQYDKCSPDVHEDTVKDLAPDGFLSLEQLRIKQPQYAQAVEEGIEYDISLTSWKILLQTSWTSFRSLVMPKMLFSRRTVA